MSITIPPFDPAAFRLLFPAFADPIVYPDDMLAGYYAIASCFVSPSCIWCDEACFGTALYLMTAHLLATTGSAVTAAMGGTGVISAATIDKVSVTRQVPTSTSEFAQFLFQSPYGMQLLALLRIKSAGGSYVGGSLERQSIRKAGGTFGPPYRGRW